MRFRPALVPTIFVVIALVILVNLGLWQLRRHEETNARIERIDAQLHGEPVGVEGLSAPPSELEWRLAEVEGRYLDVEPAFITARFEFGEPGYDVVQPLQVEGGPLILVNRGWLPSDRYRELLAETAPAGTVTVRGLVQSVGGDADAEPIAPTGDHPERWRGPNYAGMAKAWGLAPHLVVVEGESLTHPEQKDPDVYPVTGFIAKPRIRPHLEYAGTWFLIAVALVGLWIYAGIRRAQRMAGEAPS